MEEKDNEKTLSDSFTEEERIELFKSAFSNLVVSSELSVSIMYYLIKEQYDEITKLYQKYQEDLYAEIDKKQTELQKDQLKQEVGEENPDLKVETFNAKGGK